MENGELYRAISERLTAFENRITGEINRLWDNAGASEEKCRTRHDPLIADMAVLKKEASTRATWISVCISAVFVAVKILYDYFRWR